MPDPGNLVFWLLGKGPDLKLVTVQNSFYCGHHDSGVLYFDLNCMEKGAAPEAVAMRPKRDVASCWNLVPPPLGLTMSLAQVNHICMYLYIMSRHSLSAHSSSAHSLSAQVLSAHSPLVPAFYPRIFYRLTLYRRTRTC